MGQKERKLCNKVPVLHVGQIRDVAHQVRDILSSSERFNKDKLNIAGVLDHLRDKGAIEFHIVEDHELKNEYAVTVPKERIVIVRQSVYDNASVGIPRDCFTLAHELGHLLLHTNVDSVYAFSQSPSFHHYTQDAEWQANTFASELLVDSRLLSNVNNPRDIEKKFGVSFETAGYVYDRFSRESLL